MSTIKVNNIVPPNVGEGVSIDGLQMPTAGALSNRNMIINGGMVVNQRGAASYTSQNSSNVRGVDRFLAIVGTSPAVLTHSPQTTGAPDGFTHWLKISPSTADTSIASNEYSSFNQHIEGYTFARAGFGSSAAKDLAVSFKFKTNKAGTYCMIYRNGAGDRNFLYEFTPVADGNWQTISHTVPGDTSGTWLTTNDLGFRWELCLANGTALQSSTVGSWFGGSYFHSSPNQVNFLDSTSNELGITGVQLEVGSKATEFEYESYAQTLAKCMRYFQRLGGDTYEAVGVGVQGTTTSAKIYMRLLYPMRDAPTMNFSNLILTDRTAFDTPVTAFSDLRSSTTAAYANFTMSPASGVAGRAVILAVTHSLGSGYIQFGSEL